MSGCMEQAPYPCVGWDHNTCTGLIMMPADLLRVSVLARARTITHNIPITQTLSPQIPSPNTVTIQNIVLYSVRTVQDPAAPAYAHAEQPLGANPRLGPHACALGSSYL
jgi:hypothetical protein